MCEFRGLIFSFGKIQFEWHIRYHLDVNPWSTEKDIKELSLFCLTIVSNRVKMPCREFWNSFFFSTVRNTVFHFIWSTLRSGLNFGSFFFCFLFSFFFVICWWGSWNGGGGGDGSRAATWIVPTTSWRASKFCKHLLGEFFLFVSRVNFFFHRFLFLFCLSSSHGFRWPHFSYFLFVFKLCRCTK